MPLLIDAYLPDLAAGCCPNKIYALLFNKQHFALKDTGGGNYSLVAYTKAAHNTFSIILLEHAERAKYYTKEIADVNLVLPQTPEGEEYFLEVWYRSIVGPFDRDVDTLRETRRVIWSGSQWVESRLDALQASQISGYFSHVSCTYDSDNQTVYFLAWLESRGAVIPNTVRCELTWRDRLGAVISQVVQTTYMPNTPGVFRWDVPGIDVAPDQATSVMVSIRDAEGVDHNTHSSIASWD